MTFLSKKYLKRFRDVLRCKPLQFFVQAKNALIQDMVKKSRRCGVFVPLGRRVWPHETRAARILAMAGHNVEFLLENSQKSPDILLDGVEYEIKSPKTISSNTLEHLLKKGLRQCPHLIIDTSRTKMRDDKMRSFLVAQMKKTKQVKKMLLVTKKGQIIDIFGLV